MKTKVIGVNVGAYSHQRLIDVILSSSAGAAELLGSKERVAEGDIIIDEDYAGEDYGIPTNESNEALRLAARTEALIIDPVYTSKTMAGMVGMIKEKKFRRDENVCFLHTGGIPALFAYKEHFQPKSLS